MKAQSQEKPKVAVIGFGGMGEWHCRTIKESGLMEVTHAVDIDPARRAVAESYGLKTSFDAEEALSSVDVAVIALPNELHLPFVKLAASKKVNIICEKPVTLSTASYDEMVDDAKRAGVVFTVHQNRRWDPDFAIVRRIAEEKIIGDVYEIESAVTGSHGIPGGWRKKKECGGGMVLDWGVHLLDQLLLFDKSGVKEMHTDLSFIEGFEVDDGFTIRLKFNSGLKASVIVDTNCFINRPRWRVNGVDGTAIIENWSLDGKIVRVKEREDKFLRGIHAGNGFTKTMADRSAVTVEQLPLPPHGLEPYAFYKNFVASVKGDEQPAVKPAEVRAVLEIMERALASERD